MSIVPAAGCGCPSGPEDLTSDDFLVAGSLPDESGDSGSGTPSAECVSLCRSSPAWQKYSDAGFFDGEISVNSCEDNGDGRVRCSIDTDCAAGRRAHGDTLGPAPCSSARDYWRFVATLERSAVGAFEELALTLLHHHAPADLVRRAREAADDERRHADATMRLAGEEGDVMGLGPVAREPLTLLELGRLNAREGCVLEAFAALQVAWQARHVESPALASALARIASDEAMHAELAWDVDAWVASCLPEDQRHTLESAKRDALDALPRFEERAAWMDEVGLCGLPALRGLRDAFARSLV